MTSLTCNICPRWCRLEEGQTGFCRIRGNAAGRNVDVTGEVIMLQELDSFLLTDGTTKPVVGALFPGCNLQCYCCIYPDSWNWRSLSDWRRFPDVTDASPSEVVGTALCRGVEMLTTGGGEPSIHYEYLLELFALCRGARLTSDLATNGYTEPWLSEALSTAVDVPTVSFKASASPTFYRKMNADPETVMNSARIFYANNPNTHISNLVGPDLDISRGDHEGFAAWVKENLAADIPLELKYALNPRSPAWFTDCFERTHEQAFYEACSKYLRDVATVLTENGLTNVFWNDPLDIRDGKECWARLH
jgi:pyruvate formate lyase activating enzyme